MRNIEKLRIYKGDKHIVAFNNDYSECSTITSFIDSFFDCMEGKSAEHSGYGMFDAMEHHDVHIITWKKAVYVCKDIDGKIGSTENMYFVGLAGTSEEYRDLLPEYFI